MLFCDAATKFDQVSNSGSAWRYGRSSLKLFNQFTNMFSTCFSSALSLPIVSLLPSLRFPGAVDSTDVCHFRLVLQFTGSLKKFLVWIELVNPCSITRLLHYTTREPLLYLQYYYLFLESSPQRMTLLNFKTYNYVYDTAIIYVIAFIHTMHT